MIQLKSYAIKAFSCSIFLTCFSWESTRFFRGIFLWETRRFPVSSHMFFQKKNFKFFYSRNYPAEKVRGPSQCRQKSRVAQCQADNKGDFKELYRNFDIIFEITSIIGLCTIIDVARSLTVDGTGVTRLHYFGVYIFISSVKRNIIS